MSPSSCNACPVRLNVEKRLAIAIYALAVIKTPEAIQALKSIEVLAGLEEVPSCEICEVTP